MSKYDKILIYTVISLLCEVSCVAALIFDVGSWLRTVGIIGLVVTTLTDIMSVIIVDHRYRKDMSYRDKLERFLN